jgi:hypothetical protein
MIPKGSWNLYAIDGCLDDDGTFADYPMIALTDNELFFTYNEVDGDFNMADRIHGHTDPSNQQDEWIQW